VKGQISLGIHALPQCFQSLFEKNIPPLLHHRLIHAGGILRFGRGESPVAASSVREDLHGAVVGDASQIAAQSAFSAVVDEFVHLPPENRHDFDFEFIAFLASQVTAAADEIYHHGVFPVKILPGGIFSGLNVTQQRTVGRVRPRFYSSGSAFRHYSPLHLLTSPPRHSRHASSPRTGGGILKQKKSRPSTRTKRSAAACSAAEAFFPFVHYYISKTENNKLKIPALCFFHNFAECVSDAGLLPKQGTTQKEEIALPAFLRIAA